MTLPSPRGIAAGETGDPAQVVTPDPVADPAPPVTEDAGGGVVAAAPPREALGAPLLHPARGNAEAPGNDASNPSARADFISACPPTVRRAAAGVVATTTPAVADLLAGVAALLERAGDGEPDEPLNRQAAGLCRKAGTDPQAIPARIEEGRRRRAAARMPPAGGLRGG